jgi:hypothetical protein
MTLLSAVNDVLGEMGLDSIQSVASSTNQRSLSLMGVCKAAQKDIGRRNWPVLQAEHTFTTVVDQAEYDLPADFKALISDTAYNTENATKLKGSSTPQEWQWMVQNGQVSISYRFRVSGYASKFRITPTPTAAEEISFWYRSTNLAVSEGGVEKELAVLDTDLFKFDEDLVKRHIKWRYARQRGLDYAEDYRDAYEALDREFAAAISLPDVIIGASERHVDITDGFVPETGFGA